MQNYDVWMEGFAMNGTRATAGFLGTYNADSFLEACKMAWNDHREYGNYDEEKNTIYGCRLFDNEAEARKDFG